MNLKRQASLLPFGCIRNASTSIPNARLQYLNDAFHKLADSEMPGAPDAGQNLRDF
jgi:hypothetical protein